MDNQEAVRRANLNLVLDDIGQLVNESEVFAQADSGLPERYLTLTRDEKEGIWARSCQSIADAERIFTDECLAENKEEAARRPLALADLDNGTITYEIHVSISVEGRPEPLTEPELFLAD